MRPWGSGEIEWYLISVGPMRSGRKITPQKGKAEDNIVAHHSMGWRPGGDRPGNGRRKSGKELLGGKLMRQKSSAHGGERGSAVTERRGPETTTGGCRKNGSLSVPNGNKDYELAEQGFRAESQIRKRKTGKDPGTGGEKLKLGPKRLPSRGQRDTVAGA